MPWKASSVAKPRGVVVPPPKGAFIEVVSFLIEIEPMALRA